MHGRIVRTGAALIFFAPALLAAQGTNRATRPAEAPSPPARVFLTVAPGNNEARYIVHEQLVGADLPNDAVGTTSTITGAIVLDEQGRVDSTQSVIAIDVSKLKSDKANRDRYLRTKGLVTDTFPTATLRVTSLVGLGGKLPTAGTVNFQVVGDLTVHGVTRRTTWDATATATPTGYTGKVATRVKFGDFGMTQPKIFVVLSVVDDIRLEWDFTLVRATPPGS